MWEGLLSPFGGCSWASGGERLIRPGMKRVPKVVGPWSLQHTESGPKGIKPECYGRKTTHTVPKVGHYHTVQASSVLYPLLSVSYRASC